MKINFIFALGLMFGMSYAMEQKEQFETDIVDNAVVVSIGHAAYDISELDFTDSEGRRVPIDEFLMQLNVTKKNNQAKKDLQQLSIKDYNALYDRTITRKNNGKKISTWTLLREILVIERERNEIMKQQLEEQVQSGKKEQATADKALKQQVDSAKFYRRTTMTSGAVNFLLFVWSVVSTSLLASLDSQEPSAMPSFTAVNSTC